MARRVWVGCAVLAAAAMGAGAAEFEPAATHTWDLPAPDLYAVHSRGDRVWVVGAWGSVIRSEDGGETWRRSATPTDEALFDVSFAGPSDGWVVGANGTVLHTADGGVSWEPQSVTVVDEFGDGLPLDTHLFGVAAVSPREAWAVGDFGVVLRCRDGRTWSPVTLAEEAYADDDIRERIWNAVRFSSPERGWIAGEFGTILRTRDGGETWVGERTFVDTPEDLYLFDVSAHPDSPAAAVGLAGTVLVSEDGGAVWEPRNVATTAGLFAVAWRGQSGVAVGDRGVLFTTSDGGRSWLDAERPRVFNWLTGAAWGSDALAFAVGEQGLILRSADGGASWARVSGRTASTLEGVATPHSGPSAAPGTEGGTESAPEPGR